MFQSPHIRLLVDDLPACFRFYRDVIGLTPRFGSEDDVYIEFSAGDHIVALYRRDLMREVIGEAKKPVLSVQNRAILVFATEDVDKAADALRAKGVALAIPPQNRPEWGCRTVHFHDPDNHLLEVNGPLTA